MIKFLFNALVLILLIVPDTHAARKKGKGRNDPGNPRSLRVVAIERNSEFPVYKAKVSFVSFSGTKKDETDGNGAVEMQFPSGETVAVSITAEGYHPTSTKGYKLSKDRTIKVKMRRNGRSEPLPTPIPTKQPTNPPSNPTFAPTKVPGNPTPSYPTPPPGYPTPRPTIRPTLSSPGVNPPVITTHPKSQIVQRFQRVTLTVAASGTGPFTYQWYVNGQIASSSGPSFALPYSGGAFNQQYIVYCVVSNAGGSTKSNNAVIRVVQYYDNGGLTPNYAG